MKDMLKDMMRKLKDTKGATAVEYGLMVALIAVAIIVTVTALGGGLNGLFTTVTAAL
ncbi:MAG TPA: Flp family type IVb pilin [Nitrospirota bacterium]